MSSDVQTPAADERTDSGARRVTQPHRGLTRDLAGLNLAEVFLVAAVVALLAIRGFLALTGYPQVGGSTLHIAHLLWGGLAMLVALLLLLLLVGSRVRAAAALIGGLGFGAFIDELGKFITKDNDYFFRPAVALIYLVFLAVFALVQFLSRHWAPSRAERLSYAYGALIDLAAGRLGRQRRRRALQLLREDDQRDDDGDRLVREVAELLAQAPPPATSASWWTKITRVVDRSIEKVRDLIARPAVRRAVIGLFFLLVAGLVAVIVVRYVRRGDLTPPVNALSIAAAVTVLAIGALSVLGVVQLMRGARTNALESFHWAALVGLLIGQFVAFIALQFFALIGLAVNVLVLVALRAELSVEDERSSAG